MRKIFPASKTGFTSGFKKSRSDRKTARSSQGRELIAELEPRLLFATVTVNANQSLRSISPQLTGTNLTYWQYELSTAKLQGMISAAGLKLFRLPGGSGADGFHFTDAPPYGGYNTVPIIANAVQNAGGNAIVTLDYGSGSPQESAAELAYLNGSTTSTVAIGNGQVWSDSANSWQTRDFKTAGYWASLRAAKPLATDDGLNFLRVNHAAPWSFSYYEIGNEEYATWETDHYSSTGKGGTSPTNYISFAKQFSTYAAQIDPNVKIGIDVSPALKYNMPDANWTHDLLTQSASQGFSPGFLSDHAYITGLSDTNLLNHSVNDPAFTMDNYSASWAKRASFYRNLLTQDLGSSGASVQLMLTEFNSDINTKQADNLVGGLWAADALGGLAQTEYTGAVEWDLTNGYNALTTADTTHYGWRQGVDEGLLGTGSGPAPATGAYVPYPIYFADQLFSKLAQTGGTVIPVTSTDANLSVYAVKESNGHIRLLVINKNSTSSLNGTFNFTGFTPATGAQEWQYGKAEDTAQSLTTDGHSSLTATTPTLSVSGSSFTTAFPSYSMSVLDLTPGTVTAPQLSTTFFSYLAAPRQVIFTFNQAIDPATLSTSDLVLTNQSGGSVPTVTSATLDSSGTTVTFGLGITIPDGNYSATVPTGALAGTTGLATTSAATTTFFYLTGDANNDRHVDSADQAILSGRLGSSGNFAVGDFDGDGQITSADQALLTANYGAWLPTQGPVSLPTTSNPSIYTLKRESSSLVDIYANSSATGTPAYRLFSGAATSLSLAGGAGNDSLTVDLSNGQVIPAGGLFFDGGAGTDTLSVLGSTAADAVTFANGNVTINGAVVTTTTIESLSFDGRGGLDTLVDNSTLPLSIFSAQKLASLTIGAGAAISVASGGGKTLQTQSLSLTPTSILDLNDNDLIDDYSVSSPYAAVAGLIASGRAGGAWNGYGIISTAAKNNSLHNTTLGVLESTEYRSVYGAGATFDGQAIDATALLVKYTLYGDTDFNGKIDANDYGRLDAGYQNQRTPGFVIDWFSGDFNFDGVIDANDYALIDGAYQTQGSGLIAPSNSSSVPPPVVVSAPKKGGSVIRGVGPI